MSRLDATVAGGETPGIARSVKTNYDFSCERKFAVGPSGGGSSFRVPTSVGSLKLVKQNRRLSRYSERRTSAWKPNYNRRSPGQLYFVISRFYVYIFRDTKLSEALI